MLHPNMKWSSKLTKGLCHQSSKSDVWCQLNFTIQYPGFRNHCTLDENLSFLLQIRKVHIKQVKLFFVGGSHGDIENFGMPYSCKRVTLLFVDVIRKR